MTLVTKAWLATYFDLPYFATPQPKSCLQPQPRAICFFDGRNSQLQPQVYYIEVPNLEFYLNTFQLISKFFIFLWKIAKILHFWATKIVTYNKRKQIVLSLLPKMCDIAVALCKPENAPHAHTLQVTTKIGSARTSQLATAHHSSASCGRTSQVMLWNILPF